MAKAVQDFNFFYWFLRPLVQFGAVCHYRTFTVKGKENLPKDGGYILAPCHQQALMEPLAVLNITKKSPVFVARADIFKKPAIKKALLFLKIMPIFRIRDGKESLSKNQEIFDKSRAVVLDGYPFCMMAEGTHNHRHQLLPLVKGMFRIAGETQRALGNTPLYIVPTGIDFDEYEEPYANLCVNLGKPIPIQPFMQTFTENEPVALNQMRDTVAEAMMAQMHDIRSKEHYEEIMTLCDVLNPMVRKERGFSNKAFNRFRCRQTIANMLDKQEQAQSEGFAKLMETTRKYIALCKKLNLKHKTETEHYSIPMVLLSLLVVAAAVGLFVASTPVRWVVSFLLACYPILIIPTRPIFTKIIKDPQFRSSINFGARFFSSLIYTLIFSIIMGVTAGGVWGDQLTGIHGFWWWLAAFDIPFIMAYFSGYLTSWLRKTWRSLGYWFRKASKPSEMKQLLHLRKEIEQTYSHF